MSLPSALALKTDYIVVLTVLQQNQTNTAINNWTVALLNQLSTDESTLAAHTASINSFTSSLSSLTGSVSTISGVVSGHTTTLAGYGTRLSNIESAATALAQRVFALESTAPVRCGSGIANLTSLPVCIPWLDHDTGIVYIKSTNGKTWMLRLREKKS